MMYVNFAALNPSAFVAHEVRVLVLLEKLNLAADLLDLVVFLEGDNLHDHDLLGLLIRRLESSFYITEDFGIGGKA